MMKEVGNHNIKARIKGGLCFLIEQESSLWLSEGPSLEEQMGFFFFMLRNQISLENHKKVDTC